VDDGPGENPGPFVFIRPTAWACALALLSVGFLLVAYHAAIHFTGEPYDGALQFFNPLRRLAAGQRPGRDFEVYHGVGLPYLLVPLFRALGGDIYASEIIRQIAVPATLVAGYAGVFAAFTRSLRRTVVLTTLATLATMALPLTTILIPGSSILGVRTAMPLALIAVLALPANRVRLIAEGALLGLMPLLSVEQGTSVVIAYVGAFLLATVRSESRSDDARRLLAVVGIMAVTFGGVLLIIAGPRGIAGVIHYAAVDIPGDQFWFFGAPPSPALDAISRITTRPDIIVILVIGLVSAVWAVRAIGRRGTRSDPAAIALAVLAIFGLLSAAPLVGSWLRGYTNGLVRALLITLLVVLDRRAQWGLGSGYTLAPRRWWPEWTAIVLFLLALVTDTVQVLDVITAPEAVVAGEYNLSKSMSDDWRSTIRLAQSEIARTPRLGGATPIWSTYSGVVDAAAGVINPSRFDYLIHALGAKNRADYLESFRKAKPAIVQTIDPGATLFEEWLEVTNWEFYRTLVIGYRNTVAGPWSIFWERLPSSGSEPRLVSQWNGPLPDSGFTFSTPANSESILFEVEVRYTIDNPWHAVPVLGRLPRHYIVIAGAANVLPIPLAPYNSVVRFPVIALNAGGAALFSETRSLLPGPTVRVSSVRVFRYPTTGTDLIWLTAFRSAAEKKIESILR
jgi:hypothetical protein